MSICQYLQYNQKEKDKLVLEAVQHNIITLLATDIETALNPSLFDKTFLLLKKFINQDNESRLTQNGLFNFILSDQSALYVNNFKNMLIFDLQNLKDIIAKIFPTYLLYKIELNGNNIITNNVNNHNYLITKHHKINNNTKLLVKLDINPNSNYYFSNTNKLYKYLFLNITVSLILCPIILYLYLQTRLSTILKIEQLEDDLFALNKMNNALNLYKKASKNLNSFFIRSATEEYIKQQLKVDHDQEIKLDKIDPSNYLFPICFTNHFTTEIDVKKLISYLQDYFADHFLYTAITYQYKSDKLVIDCGQHVFYQIIFSIVYNVLKFMEDQSDTPKSLLITFTTDKLIISHEGFVLTEATMINLSNSLILETIDPFLLSCSKIFQSLKTHGLNYKIFTENKKNIIEIALRKNIITNKDKTKVINFAKYKQKNELPELE
ncbi:hypothetical protein [Candidatus Tisiphia endosymbiont of Nemotelus uliginosus]|uniref:hypothetical protein n=1 Tax=Candidatus Tisiphia endosymbiont of Nemotelus uliginosus TaxID=3077926 RepID=UPI0035C8C2BD